MSNLKIENFDLEDDLDYWEIFQSETDDTRNLILDYLVKKCDMHKQDDFSNFKPFEKLDDNGVYHFDNCNKFLFESERRRKPFKNGKLLYFHAPCKDLKENSKCIKGDICDFSHTQLETKFHPINYRKEPCNYPDCDKNKRYCNKYHRAQDLRCFPYSRKNSSNFTVNNKNEKFFTEVNNKKFQTKNIDDEQLPNLHRNTIILNEDKEEMLNKLNFDIKNLLDELDLDQLDVEDEEKRGVNDDRMDLHQIENVDKNSRTFSTNSKNNENLENYAFDNFKNNRSNSNSSVNQLRNNLLVDCNKMNMLNKSNNETSQNHNSTNISGNLEKELTSQKFDLQTFKTIKCNIVMKHNEKHCIYFHSNKDRRRLMIKYSSDSCKYASSDKNCPDGDFCLFSHNKVEMFYHPDRFKTKFCSQYSFDSYLRKKSLQNCAYGKYCSFAHSEEEIKIELIHKLNFDEDFFLNNFKTVVCPFTHDHDKATCVYSHNWQDYRRNPKKFTYKNNPCQIWDIKKTILNYRDGCPQESSCLHCHGWKEEDFHPLNYKTKKCKNFNKQCEKSIYCPFFHTLDEKRKIPHKIKQEYDTRLENKVNVQKYSNLLNDSFNNINRSNSVKSNLSDNVSYNNQNRKVNYNLNLNIQNNNLNFQNINQYNIVNQNNMMSNNKINPNFNQKNMMNFSPNHSNTGNINYMPSPMFNVHPNNSMNIGNFHNINILNKNNMINYNPGRNIQFGKLQNNNQMQQKYSSNSITNVNQLLYEQNKLNHSRNMMNNLNNNNNNNNNNYIWGFPNQFPYQNNISPNNSIGKGSFSDNELNDNQFFNSNNSRNNYRSFSSHFSNSSSDQLNESLKYEKDYEMILGNPDDDSIDMNEMDNSQNKKYIANGASDQFYGKNDLYYIEKIENTNNFLRELIKEGESNLNDERADMIDQNFLKEESLNKDNFLYFLKFHKFLNLYNLIKSNRIILNDLVKFSDEKIVELIEEENKPKANKLIEVLMKFDEKLEGDDVMESLNNLDFK